jgi:hypothetical protein
LLCPWKWVPNRDLIHAPVRHLIRSFACWTVLSALAAAVLAAQQLPKQLERRFNETRGAHFRVVFEGPEDQAMARRVVEMLEQQHARIGQLLRSYPDESIDVVLYTLQQFQDVTRAPAWAVGAYDGVIRIPARGADNNVADLERVLAHEFVHALVASLGGPSVPAWLNEGLAVVLEPRGRVSVDDLRRMLELTDKPPQLDALNAGFGGMNSTTAQLAYAVSAVAVQRMLDRRGPDAVVVLLKDLAAGVPFPVAFRQRISLTYEEFADRKY